MLNHHRLLVATALAALLPAAAGAATKDESRILPTQQVAEETSPATPLPLPIPGSDTQPSGTEAPAAGDDGAATGEDLTEPDPNAGESDEGVSPDDMSIGEIPVIETVELTFDMAKRAIDSYVMVKTKYAEANLEQYETLQDFVDQDPMGKDFDADIKGAGFATIDAWNVAVTSLSIAYTAAGDDPTDDIKQQIAEIEADDQIAQDMKDRMIKSLTAMIPSDNNRKVVDEIMKDPAYAEKLKQLDTEYE